MTPRQRRFVEEYLLDLNGHQAALRAHYAPRCARQTVTSLLRRPEIADAIRQAMEERSQRTRVTADRVLLELARIAFADLSRLAEWGPGGMTLRPYDSLSPEDVAAVAEITAGGPDGSALRLRLHNKLHALDSIARHLGLFGRSVATLDAAAAERMQERAAHARAMRETLRRRIAALARDGETMIPTDLPSHRRDAGGAEG